MAGIGHNSGQVIEPGLSWRTHVWTKARKDLLPTLPIEVVRLRVKRAQELGLPYKTYAGIRASTGHDLIGFLFSSNALQVLRAGQAMPEVRAAKLDALVDARRIGLAHAPVTATHLAMLDGVDRAYTAPRFVARWSMMRDQLVAVARAEKTSGDRFVLVGDTAFEREWTDAAKLAGYLSAETYFAQQQG